MAGWRTPSRASRSRDRRGGTSSQAPASPSPEFPVPLTPIIGRSHEIETVSDLLRRPDVRLLTLTGPPGVGKTRLALSAAIVLHEEFQSGAFFVNLSAIRDPDLFEHTVIHTLGLRRFVARPPLERLARHLSDRHVLLVLDNFEQVIAASAAVVALLSACPRLKVLVTSREALRVGAEHEFPVHPLALPNPAEVTDLPALGRAAAIALFVARAEAVQPDFRLTKENGPLVAEICGRLDGLPLAIELAAARVKVLPPRAILARLAPRLPFLIGDTRDLPERQQTLRAAIAWSEELLEPEERTVFHRLAVFAGGFTLEAAQAVAITGLAVDVLSVITGLVNKSLFRHEPTTTGDPRFGMLETIREYAWERLAASSDGETTRDRHVEYYLALAERAKKHWGGRDGPVWAAVMDQEYENLRAALRWATERANTSTELRLAAAICRFWNFRGNAGEAYKWIDAALAKSGEASPAIRAELLVDAAVLTGNAQQKAALEQEALVLARNAGDRETVVRCLMNLGGAYFQSDPQRARAFVAEGLTLARVADDSLRVGLCLNTLAVLAQVEGELERAARLFGAAEAALEPHGFAYTPYSIVDQTVLGRSIVAVLRGLGQQAFGAAWAEGRRMPLEVAAHYALGRLDLPEPAPPAPPNVAANPLTSRELEVARLVTQGLSNREIGKTLVISERTVDAHVQHILNKLGFNSRAQVAAWVAASGEAPVAR